jgi:hypothetical protein
MDRQVGIGITGNLLKATKHPKGKATEIVLT